MKFAYRAKERSGKVVAGEIEAESLVEARQRLRAQGAFILSINVLRALQPGVQRASPGWRRKVKRSFSSSQTGTRRSRLAGGRSSPVERSVRRATPATSLRVDCD